MATELRKKLVKQILQKGISMANEDDVMRQLMKNSEGETMLFIVEDLKAPYGFLVRSDRMEFVENPDLNQEYGLVAICNENTLVHMLRGEDPENMFWGGYIDVTGKGWFRKVMLLRRFFSLGEKRGLKAKVVGK